MHTDPHFPKSAQRFLFIYPSCSLVIQTKADFTLRSAIYFAQGKNTLLSFLVETVHHRAGNTKCFAGKSKVKH